MSRHLEHGILRLLEDLHLVGTPQSGFSSGSHALHLHDGHHLPIRYRVLLHARDVEGLSWVECGRLLGITGSAAVQSYDTWKPRQCCPPDAPCPTADPDTSSA